MNLNSSTEYKPVCNYSELGEGRQKRKFLLGDTDDARTANFFGIGEIRHRWYCHRQIWILIDNRIRIVEMEKNTMDGRPVYFFPINNLTQSIWERQQLGKALIQWMETANSADSLAMMNLVLERTESGHRPCTIPGYHRWLLPPIKTEITKLSVTELRQLRALIEEPQALRRAA